jgi:lysine 2,3-aminomutase
MWQGDVIRLSDVEGLSKQEKQDLQEVVRKFPFRANKYYLDLIDWTNPEDPLRRAVIPDMGELGEWGRLDASDEHIYYVMPGVQHKYDSTLLLLVSNQCAGICRYCFRKRIFLRPEILRDVPRAMNYLREHKEITNVLVTGGDPLTLDTERLESLLERIREIEHVGIVRIGTRIPAFNPFRVIDDPSLVRMLRKHNSRDKRIYIMTHFLHPRELTDVSIRALDLLFRSGVVLANQSPLIRGVNDDPGTLADLFKKLAFVGASQYYLFQCRPAVGNKIYAVPVEDGYRIFEQAKSRVSGLAKRVRYVMSHSTGKVEMVGRTGSHVYFKYHRTPHNEDSGPLWSSEPTRKPTGSTIIPIWRKTMT